MIRVLSISTFSLVRECAFSGRSNAHCGNMLDYTAPNDHTNDFTKFIPTARKLNLMQRLSAPSAEE